MLASLAGLPVVSFKLAMPLNGVWHASIAVSSPGDSAPSNQCQLLVTNEDDAGNPVTQLTATGQPRLSTTQVDSIVVTFVAGADGLATTCLPRSYRGNSLGAVLNDILGDGGETLSGSIDPNLLFTSLSGWTVLKRTVAENLDMLCEQLGDGYNWRMMLDGTVWLGKESWPVVAPVTEVETFDPIRNALVMATQDALIVPGQSYTATTPSGETVGGKVNYTQIDLVDGKLRQTLFFGSTNTSAQLRQLIKRTLPDVDFHALYRGTVTGQNADGTCNITLDDASFPGYQGVPIKLGIPGASVKVAPGAAVLMGFDNGWPEVPYVALWESATLTSINIGGSSALATDAAVIAQLATISGLLSGIGLTYTVPTTVGTTVLKGG